MTLFSVRNLGVQTLGGESLLSGVGFTLEKGQILGLVGESGSGKSLTTRAIMRLLPGKNLAIVAGEVLLEGEDLTSATPARMAELRGSKIGMIFQNPSSHLDPVMSIGAQISEAIRIHRPLAKQAARREAEQLMEQVGFTDPPRQYGNFAHEFSGGMRQRAMIAIALACNPEILIADEPTTALDVTVQAQVLQLLKDLRDKRGLAIILITHDLGVVAQTADKIAVMRHGRIVEIGPVRQILRTPQHDYTRRLIASHPTADLSLATAPTTATAATAPLIEAQGVGISYALPGGYRWRKKTFEALQDVNLSVWPGELVGIVGESGSGKSTLARVMMGLQDASRGAVRFNGRSLADKGGAGLLDLRNRAAMIFQDPYNALNPRYTIGDSIAEVLRVKGRVPAAAIPAKVAELLIRVELPASFAQRKPRSLSGGECQRAGIARALAIEPELLFADECLAALDVTIQAQIIELFRKLAREMNLAIVFIAHDLAVVHNLCARTIVMQQGRIVEEGPTARLFAAPATSYTKTLLAAIPSIDPDRPLGAAPK